MDTEQKILIALLGNTSAIDIKSLLEQEFDWRRFIKIATDHRLIPAIFYKLRLFSVKLPPEIDICLQNFAKKCSTQNLKLNSRLIDLAARFEENQIEFLSYKGATLAQLAYGSTALREFGDLDVLIHKKDFAKVKRVILENGGIPAWDLSAKQEKAVLRYYYEFPFKFGENPVPVEIHWAFMESFFGFHYEKEDIFRRMQKVSIHGKAIPTLANEDLLIVLCVHGSKHFWKRLIWIYDIGKLIESQPIDWNLVIDLSRKFGCVRMLTLGLLLAENITKTDLPEKIHLLIKNDKEVASLAEKLKEQLFDNKFSPEETRVKIHLKMRERQRDKFAYSSRLFMTKLVDSLFMPMGRPR